MPGGFNKGIPIHVHNPEGIDKWNENEMRCKQAFRIEIISFTGDCNILLLWENKQSCAPAYFRKQKSYPRKLF